MNDFDDFDWDDYEVNSSQVSAHEEQQIEKGDYHAICILPNNRESCPIL